MKFAKEFLQEREGETIYDKIITKTRWSVIHERVFKYNDRFYKTSYSCGATEQQIESPYEYDGELVECQEVFPKTKTITYYE